ncbi:MAG: cytochrome P450 [Candidatus Promineofilum sp.]|nr:cytochrome P450 [Promineifilum sp.]
MEFDPRSPAFRANPYPFYDMLRAFAPIFYWQPWGMWFLTTHEDCHALLRDDRFGHLPLSVAAAPPSQRALWQMQTNWLLTMNPPDHTRLRGLVQKAFTPRAVAQLRATIQRLTDALIDRMAEKEQVDVIADLAYPLPVAVICEMLGVPLADQGLFHAWSAALVRSLDLTDEPAVYNRASVAAAEMTAYFDALLAERRAQPQTDILSALVAAEEAGDRLTTEELFGTCALLLVAGHETTVNLIGNGTLALLRHPDQWQRLRDEPGLIASAVEELLRYDSPVQLTSRAALTDVTYKGQRFPRGTFVTFLLGAANHDPAVFADPARLDVGRANNRHLAFGGGIHYCLGAPLARLEGEIALGTLARRLPTLALAGGPPVYRDNVALRGLEALPAKL